MDLNMKPSLAVDEMFSEGAGYMDMEEASRWDWNNLVHCSKCLTIY